MNDYNDGQVWGWNGGECPVHPQTVVKVWFRGKDSGKALASGFRWNRKDLGGDIIAFQVIEAYAEPKTIWVNEYAGRSGGYYYNYYTDEQVAKRTAGHNATRIAVKYVEARDD